MSKPDELDAIAWRIIKAAKVYPPSQIKHRPRDYSEMGEQLRSGGDLELIWAIFSMTFTLTGCPATLRSVRLLN